MTTKMVEISVIVPKKLKIMVPQSLFDEFEQMIQGNDLNTIITEALTEELKKMRFRADLEKIISKVA
jgi:hypothetical protein